MNLYFMRHGIALPPETSSHTSDRDRPLSPKGTKRVRKAAKGIYRLGISFDAVLSSPFLRARQTADIVAGALRKEITTEEIFGLAPERSVADLMADLTPYKHRDHLLLVGHEPSLSDILSHLLHGQAGTKIAVKFKKGTVCRIFVDVLPPTGPATLEWLLTPKQLRLLGTGPAKRRHHDG